MTIAFLSIFAVGLLLAVLSWVMGELFELGGSVADSVGGLATGGTDAGLDAGVDLATGVDMSTPSPVSSRVVFSGLTAFGGLGYVGAALGWPLAATLILATGGFVGGASAMFFGVIVPISRQQGSLRVSRTAYMGMDVSVETAIPSQGSGQVTLTDPNSGVLVTESAISDDGTEIARGTAATVVRVTAGGLVVRRKQQ